LIKARWEKEGQRRSVIILAGNLATTTIGCNCLHIVNPRARVETNHYNLGLYSTRGAHGEDSHN
jgi:hypothetical protein